MGYTEIRWYLEIFYKMNIQSKVNELHKNLVSRLCSIKEFPEGFFPHMVFVEEEDAGGVIYRQYLLTEIFENGDCTLINSINQDEREDSMLQEICIDWLVTLWNWYLDLSWAIPQTAIKLKH